MLSPLLALATLLATERPIGLHPDNPHYFLFRGQPTVLVTSGEHYGAVLNLDFDFVPYLDELKARGFNLTRTFSGTYREVPGSFRIRHNTLAPAPGRYISPWVRDGEKFDLDRFDDAYFRRLKTFLAEAGRRGIIVELVLFCPLYEDTLWDVSPMNARNNVNGVGRCPRTEALTLKHPELVERQVAFVRKVVAELKDVDNLYYEVCNEPYFGGVTREWQDRIIATIVAAERDFPARHLIAQNIANGKEHITDPNPAVSIFNFHYARPPETVALNYGLNKPLGDDETGFQKTADRPYRTEGWDFLIAGGSVYSNLDYSFTTDHEDGTAEVTDPTPGGGGPSLRRQLQVLKQFLTGFDFLQMAPDNTVIKGGIPPGATARALVERGKQYAIYVNGGTRAALALDLPRGRYRAEWVNTKNGAVEGARDLDHAGGRVVLESPAYTEDIALRVVAALPPKGASSNDVPSSPTRRLLGATGSLLPVLRATAEDTGSKLPVAPVRRGTGKDGSDARMPPKTSSDRLKVSENRRFLAYEDGSPFFYLGDTAWELFHRLNREEADLYLRDRAAKGFTVIQAVVLAELDGLHVPNPYGDTPLIGDDPARPNEAYFRHVDFIVDRAAALGLFVGMLPTWGDKVNKKWGIGPEVFTPENARAYGAFLGRRYRDRPIIWILGGDRPVETDGHRAIWRAMAAGLKDGDGGRHLITYHPMGRTTSADALHGEPWLDFNMLQSGHSEKDLANDEMIARDYARRPIKPCLDGEPRYEDHPVRQKPEQGWFDAYDVRKAAYWALFAGACGHTYGCHDIWQFWQEGRAPITLARTPWKEALGLPAASQVQHARRLLESRPYLDRIPDQSLIVGDPGKGGDHAQATRGADGSYALVYIPSGKPVVVDLGKLSGREVIAWWFDPRDGTAREIGRYRREGMKEFQPARGGPDWVLVLDDAGKGFPKPGAGMP